MRSVGRANAENLTLAVCAAILILGFGGAALPPWVMLRAIGRLHAVFAAAVFLWNLTEGWKGPGNQSDLNASAMWFAASVFFYCV